MKNFLHENAALLCEIKDRVLANLNESGYHLRQSIHSD